MSTRKQQLRESFRDAVFARDGYRCVVCGLQSSKERADHDLDAHHITPREQMPGGGYVVENGVSLCAPEGSGGKAAHGCHWLAENAFSFVSAGFESFEHEHAPFYRYTPKALYKAIGSSYETAVLASEYLK